MQHRLVPPLWITLSVVTPIQWKPPHKTPPRETPLQMSHLTHYQKTIQSGSRQTYCPQEKHLPATQCGTTSRSLSQDLRTQAQEMWLEINSLSALGRYIVEGTSQAESHSWVHQKGQARLCEKVAQGPRDQKA